MCVGRKGGVTAIGVDSGESTYMVAKVRWNSEINVQLLQPVQVQGNIVLMMTGSKA